MREWNFGWMNRFFCRMKKKDGRTETRGAECWAGETGRLACLTSVLTPGQPDPPPHSGKAGLFLGCMIGKVGTTTTLVAVSIARENADNMLLVVSS